jgi:hypothetical protein
MEQIIAPGLFSHLPKKTSTPSIRTRWISNAQDRLLGVPQNQIDGALVPRPSGPDGFRMPKIAYWVCLKVR